MHTLLAACLARDFSAYTEETGYLIQSLTGIRTVKSMAVEQTVRWHWEELFGKSLKTAFSAGDWQHAPRSQLSHRSCADHGTTMVWGVAG